MSSFWDMMYLHGLHALLLYCAHNLFFQQTKSAYCHHQHHHQCNYNLLCFNGHFPSESSLARSSRFWRCWLGGRKGIWPVKNWVVGCWHGNVWGEVNNCIWPNYCHCHSISLAPVNPAWLYFLVFTFLVMAHPGSLGQRDVKWVLLLFEIRSTVLMSHMFILSIQQCKSSKRKRLYLHSMGWTSHQKWS